MLSRAIELPARTASCSRPWCPLAALMVAGLVLVGDAQGQGEGNLFGPTYPRTNLAIGYEVEPAWPKRDHDEPWGAMSGIAVDEQDNVWTLNRGDLPVQVFDREGTLIRSWGRGEFDRPHQLRFGPNGSVWITDAGLHVVRKYTRDGKLLMNLGEPGVAGDDSTHFDGPTDVAITPEGELFITDGYGNNRVVHCDAEGRFLEAWGRMGVGPGNSACRIPSPSIPRAGSTSRTGTTCGSRFSTPGGVT